MTKKIIVLGGGGHCRQVLDILLQQKEYEVAGIIDNSTKEPVMGISVIGTDDNLEEIFHLGITSAFVAIGNDEIRKKCCDSLEKIGFTLISVVSPHSIISNYATLGSGTVVMPGAVLNSCAMVGNGCIINTKSSVDHDCKIGNFSHIAPGVTLCGSVVVGENSFVGAGSTVKQGVNIGKNVTIGLGSVVIRDILDGVTAYGIPARSK